MFSILISQTTNLDIPFTYMFPHVENPRGFSTTPQQVFDTIAQQITRLKDTVGENIFGTI